MTRCLLLILMEFMDHRRAFYRDPYWKFYRTGVIRLEKKKKKAKPQQAM